MFTEDKVTEIFCMADDFCRFFDAMMEKYTLKEAKKRKYHRDGTLSKDIQSVSTTCDTARHRERRIVFKDQIDIASERQVASTGCRTADDIGSGGQIARRDSTRQRSGSTWDGLIGIGSFAVYTR